jgi:hypothetical protein
MMAFVRSIITRVANGVETFESCEGGRGHSFPEPTVRFEGAALEGLRAISVALENGLPVRRIRLVWGFENNMIHGPWWEMTFRPPKDSRHLLVCAFFCASYLAVVSRSAH